MTTGSTAVVLEATELEIEFTTREGRVRSLDGANLTLGAGDITALVGESGSGKSTLALAAGNLLASNADRVGGDLTINGTSVFSCEAQALRRLRRDTLGFVFQNPVAALNPTMRVERQLALLGSNRDEAVQALAEVGLREIPRVLRSFPHELSGGMAARVGIAMALHRRPALLIADEPTAAVDATLRKQILELLVSRCRNRGCALMLLTHDLHMVTSYCSHIAVMYAGRVVETGSKAEVLGQPLHPYTRALLNALPGEEAPGERLASIPGAPPVLRGPSEGCAFAPRCPLAQDEFFHARPTATRVGRGRSVCCHLYADPASASGVGEAADTAAADIGAHG
jgi:peptide/nickel transport system ATP-binding protein